MTFYVDAKVGQTGDGSQGKPFKTISEAAVIAVAGDEVIVAPGLYREWVNPVNGGTEDRGLFISLKFLLVLILLVQRSLRAGSNIKAMFILPAYQIRFLGNIILIKSL